MTVAEAHVLLEAAIVADGLPQRWVDLGCGRGTFTCALAELLPQGSSILAVDRDADVLRALPSEHKGVTIEGRVGTAERTALPAVDGVLMANVLHFIADRATLVAQLAKITSTILLVEYDRQEAMPPWVPYPLPSNSAIELFQRAGFTTYLQLGRRASRYGPDPLYAMQFVRK